ncbi:MAG TPA: PA14 domain-containing protein, partial [Abditibacteriaceae bacterium]
GSISKVEFFHGSAKIGEDSSSPYTFAVGDVAGGNYTFTARAISNNGVTATSPPVNIVVNAVSGTGLKGEYFSGTTFSTLVKTQTDANVNFSWGTGSPTNTDGTTMSSVGPDSFSVRWTGQLQAIEGGAYTFSVVADDTAKLWINDFAGTPIINQASYNSGNPTNGTFTMMPGQKYNIKIDFTEAAGGAMMKLYWTRPGGASVIVPQSQLFPTLGLVDRTLESGGSILVRGENVAGSQTRDKAFDNSTATKWLDYAATTWIQYKFANEASRVIKSYTITSGDDAPERDPKNWTLQGSPDGTTFTNLDSRSNVIFSLRKQTRTFDITNSTDYKYYRLNITSNTSGTITQSSEIRLLGQ